jgi:hypothetical protein
MPSTSRYRLLIVTGSEPFSVWPASQDRPRTMPDLGFNLPGGCCSVPVPRS